MCYKLYLHYLYLLTIVTFLVIYFTSTLFQKQKDKRVSNLVIHSQNIHNSWNYTNINMQVWNLI